MGATATGMATPIEPMVELTPRDLDNPAPRDTEPIAATGAGANPAEEAVLCDELMVYMNPRPGPLYGEAKLTAMAHPAHSNPIIIISTFFKLITLSVNKIVFYVYVLRTAFTSFGGEVRMLSRCSKFICMRRGSVRNS